MVCYRAAVGCVACVTLVEMQYCIARKKCTTLQAERSPGRSRARLYFRPSLGDQCGLATMAMQSLLCPRSPAVMLDPS